MTSRLTTLTVAILLPLAQNTAGQEKSQLDCVIEPNVVTEISSPVEGIAEAIFVEKSDIVKLGQELARLNSGVEAAIVELAGAHARMTEEVRSRQTN